MLKTKEELRNIQRDEAARQDAVVAANQKGLGYGG
jgi:hypothetical protein